MTAAARIIIQQPAVPATAPLRPWPFSFAAWGGGRRPSSLWIVETHTQQLSLWSRSSPMCRDRSNLCVCATHTRVAPMAKQRRAPGSQIELLWLARVS